MARFKQSDRPAPDPDRLHEIGAALLAGARRKEPRPGLSEKLMDWAMSDPSFKTQLFRFVDVFPALRDANQVHAHLDEYLVQSGVRPPPGLQMGLKAGSLFRGTMKRTVESQVRAMGKRFIAGTDDADARPRLARRWRNGLGFSLDLLGETCVSEEEADTYRQRYLRAIDRLAEATAEWPEQRVLERDHLGPIPRANISVKISALAAKVDPADFEGSIERLMRSLDPVLEQAAHKGVFVNFDIEHQQLKELTLALFMRCCERHDFPAGIALQAYLRSGEDDVQRLIAWARERRRIVTVRLVKGAYWDYEMIEAERRGWPVPVWAEKAQTDACFERMAHHLIDATPQRSDHGGVKLALGSHNVRSIASALALLEQYQLPEHACELQMLYGMASGLKEAAVARGLRVREYVPVGDMIPGMAYLVRRLLENTSNESWLRAGFERGKSEQELLDAPRPTSLAPAAEEPDPTRHALSPAVDGLGDGQPFFNEPHRDFAEVEQRRRFAEALERALVPDVANESSVDDARTAVGTASAAFPQWRDTEPLERARCLVRAAARFRERRDELAGIVVRESGKNWRHADADVCEAIDFCEYYARQSVGLFRPRRLGRLVGERDVCWHEPRGVAAVISPWNFPMAICCGMTVAALVTGNPVVLKPAEQSPGIARIVAETLWDAGVPRDVLQFVPGPGETVGAALVRDSRVALICFTGSKAVGLDILRIAGDTSEEQAHVKKVVCEMGGKNAIVVDESADLDEAVPGICESAFGYSGQRCSACSRVIAIGSAHDALLERLVPAARALVVGDPLHPETDVGPVIDGEAGDKIRRYIAVGQSEGHLELGVEPPPGLEERLERPVIGPHIFRGIERGHRLAQEEIFGPVLSVMRARDITEALDMANGTGYRLTGGIYSRTPSHLERAARELRVGNLYINRNIVGSLVGRQPFGGFGLSGTGSQAGGDEYLFHFVVPRSLSENTMRRGFAPDLDA